MLRIFAADVQPPSAEVRTADAGMTPAFPPETTIVSVARAPLPVQGFGGSAKFAENADRGASRRRIYAIGDIHGHLDLLLAMLELIATDLDRHPSPDVLLVFLGDYIDRGPNSRAVISLLSGHTRNDLLDRVSKVFLRGNHEQFLIDFLQSEPVLGRWAPKGGLETLLSYGVSSALVARAVSEPSADMLRLQLHAAIGEERQRFITNLPTYHAEGGYFFAHAGVDPDRELENQKDEDLIWIRQKFLKSTADFGKVVVHGHTPSKSIESFPNRINVDTGVDMHGRLSCAVLEGNHRHSLHVARRAAPGISETQQECAQDVLLKEHDPTLNRLRSATARA